MGSWPIAELVVGLGGGTLASAAIALLVIRRRPPPGSGIRRSCGLLFTATALALLPTAGGVPIGVVAGLVAVTAAVAWARSRHLALGASIGAALPGSAVLALAADLPGLLVVTVASGIAVAAPLAARSDVVWRASGTGPTLLAISAVGVFAAVPDTEQAIVLVGVALPLALASGALRPLWLGPVGAAAAVTLLVGVAARGGAARPASIVGALACSGVLVGGPAGAALGTAARLPVLARRSVPGGDGAVVVGWHVMCVGVASRVAGVHHSLSSAVVWGTASAIAAVVPGVVLHRQSAVQNSSPPATGRPSGAGRSPRWRCRGR